MDTGARFAFLIEINKLSKNAFSVKLSNERTTFRDWTLNIAYNMRFDVLQRHTVTGLSPSAETQTLFLALESGWKW